MLQREVQDRIVCIGNRRMLGISFQNKVCIVNAGASILKLWQTVNRQGWSGKVLYLILYTEGKNFVGKNT